MEEARKGLKWRMKEIFFVYRGRSKISSIGREATANKIWEQNLLTSMLPANQGGSLVLRKSGAQEILEVNRHIVKKEEEQLCPLFYLKVVCAVEYL